MKKSLGVLLSAAGSLVALAVTTAPAKAQMTVHTYDHYSCPGSYGDSSWGDSYCYDSRGPFYAYGLGFYCGSGSVTGYPGWAYFEYSGWWGFNVTAYCADGSTPGAPPNGSWANTTSATAYCPAGVAIWYATMRVAC